MERRLVWSCPYTVLAGCGRIVLLPRPEESVAPLLSMHIFIIYAQPGHTPPPLPPWAGRGCRCAPTSGLIRFRRSRYLRLYICRFCMQNPIIIPPSCHLGRVEVAGDRQQLRQRPHFRVNAIPKESVPPLVPIEEPTLELPGQEDLEGLGQIVEEPPGLGLLVLEELPRTLLEAAYVGRIR
jgi:hypothetical protein